MTFLKSCVGFLNIVSCKHIYAEIITFLIKLVILLVNLGDTCVDPDHHNFSLWVHIFNELSVNRSYLQVASDAHIFGHLLCWRPLIGMIIILDVQWVRQLKFLGVIHAIFVEGGYDRKLWKSFDLDKLLELLDAACPPVFLPNLRFNRNLDLNIHQNGVRLHKSE